MAAALQDVEASCAICGASSQYGECPHESNSLEKAMEQAMKRWAGFAIIRDWVLTHARDQIMETFQSLKSVRYQAHMRYLQTLPCYTLFQKYGDPPLTVQQLNHLRSQMSQAQNIYQQGVDEDWRRCCMKYPEVLDYYLSLVDIDLPDDTDTAVRDPRFGGGPVNETKRIKPRRGSTDLGKGHRKRSRRRSRGRTPPAAPMPGGHRR
ncbi:uncharacterized protein LTR77_000851 [Saxophila tyrrhenica]|uniref:Uncharacterized protein n=1 Tax=Saxophila tyrrhenica TaxID=1690608 RepID=A0AAV9PPI3_9PEZI|nr:hypothetical protein LTR77_000851 [Saxophila tyrrhenica]